MLRDGSLVDPNRLEGRYGRQGAVYLEDPKEPKDQRTETEKDRGRLGYSPFLRRLAGVTQVVSPDLGASQMHSRASHSYKVALLSREIAENIVRRVVIDDDKEVAEVVLQAGGLDLAACETAGLAHDLGHPPFGHAGEHALDDFLRKETTHDGFEGNAQSFRIVAKLDQVNARSNFGLHLTNVTLAAILKYPHARRKPYTDPDNRKFGAYGEDTALLDLVRRNVLGAGVDDIGQQTLEASIMDLADDMSYAIHDLEDFLSSGLIDIRRVRMDIAVALASAGRVNNNGSLKKPGSKADFAKGTSDDAFTNESQKLRKKYAKYFDDAYFADALIDADGMLDDIGDLDDDITGVSIRTNLAGTVEKFFAGLRVSVDAPYASGPHVFLDSAPWHLMQVLKVITRRYLVSTSRMGVLQQAQSKAIENLMTGLVEWISSAPALHEIPVPLRRALNASGVTVPKDPLGQRQTLGPEYYRAISDYICTMSDAEAMTRSRWIMGLDAPGAGHN